MWTWRGSIIRKITKNSPHRRCSLDIRSFIWETQQVRLLVYKLEKRGKDLLESTLTLIHHLTHYQNHSNQSATAGCLNHPLASLHTTSPLSIPSSLFLSPPFYTLSHLLLFSIFSLFSSLPSILHLCSTLFAILLVPVIKEVWLPTVCCHSFFQTRIRHPGIGCMLSCWGPDLLPSPWLSLLPFPF